MGTLSLPYFLLALQVAAVWPLTLGIALAATAVWLVTGRRIGRFWIVLSYVPLALSITALAALYAPSLLKRGADAASAPVRTRTLTAPLQIADTTLGAGTVITDPGDTGRYVVHAGTKTLTIGQAAMTGDVDIDPNGFVSGRLAADALIDGVPCAGGTNIHLEHRKLRECRLSKPYRVAGVIFGAGTDANPLAPDYFVGYVGENPPSLRLEGRLLRPHQEVQVSSRQIIVSTPDRPLRTSTGCSTSEIAYDRSTHRSEPAGGLCRGTLPPNAITL